MSGLKRKHKVILVLLFIIIAFILMLAILWRQGIFIPNEFQANNYSVKGIDVSAYQGDINWPVIEEQAIDFAFIKATEGSSFVDEEFSDNWLEANKTSLRVGAYHFFSYDSSGKTQAENFINTVPKKNAALPPVIDVEFYGNNHKNPPKRSYVEQELRTMIELLEEQYGQRVILYATQKAYNLYIKNGFKDTDIWIRDVFTNPSLADHRHWIFWQYTDKEKLAGYNGEEKFIDMNVFHGSSLEFEAYGK